ncbi:MAG: hypothetical protein Q8P67_23785 [archaeon]|nr:hypothetical protein [archaeon]
MPPFHGRSSHRRTFRKQSLLANVMRLRIELSKRYSRLAPSASLSSSRSKFTGTFVGIRRFCGLVTSDFGGRSGTTTVTTTTATTTTTTRATRSPSRVRHGGRL